MAEISDLTTQQQTDLLAYDFNDLWARMNAILAKIEPHNDEEKVELDYVKGQLLILEEIVLASGNTAAVTAYAILNP